jgi:alkanesulfonate monooxygenase SsuD/methylene tetrahydromethanopterin reductase-like flavin-dependent oxidoreductase (luciferase family)
LKFTFSNLPATGWALPAGRIADLARLAEEVGFDRFAIADLPYHYDCVTVMTACLLATGRLEVESLVTNPTRAIRDWWRRPGRRCRASRTGAPFLGIGGGVESATRVYVSPWSHERPHPASAVREAVQVYRAMWRGEKVTLDGEVVHVHGATLDCPPPPPIKILVASRGPAMLKLAGEVADIAHLASLFLDPEHQRDNIRRVVAGARGAGRDPNALEIDLSVTVSVSADRAYARREAKRNAAQTILWMAGPTSTTRGAPTGSGPSASMSTRR